MYVEILSESRQISLHRTSGDQDIVIEFCLPEDRTTSAIFLGDDDDITALEYAYSILPEGRWLPLYNGGQVFLVLDQIQLSERSNQGRWKATAKYKYDINTGQGGTHQPGNDPDEMTLPFIRVGFSAGNNTKTITRAREVVDVVQALVPITNPLPCDPFLQKTIGATEQGISGAEVYDHGLNLQITAYYYPWAITPDFLYELGYHIAPSVNADTFLGYPPGTCLLTGVDGGGVVNDIIPLTFNIIVKPNIVDEPDAPFPDINCEGHDIIDYTYLKTYDECAQIYGQEPTYRYVHRYYKKTPFVNLGFPT